MKRCFIWLGIFHLAVSAGVAQTSKPDANNAGLKLPAGFVALKVADGLGAARHLAVAPNGNIFVKLENLKSGKGIYWLRDPNKDGRDEQKTGFGNYIGTGMYIKGNYLYASSNTDIYRYKLDDNFKPDTANPEKLVTGLLARHQHESKSIIVDNDGNLYTNIGAYSNACQEQDRTKGSTGRNPCPILDSAGGIWQFRADKTDQTYGDGVHYATGLRNVVGLDWNTQTNSLFVTQHGRDQLGDLYPDLYTAQQSAELPAECMYELHKGSNCGWPYIYYDQIGVGALMRVRETGGKAESSGLNGVSEPRNPHNSCVVSPPPP